MRVYCDINWKSRGVGRVVHNLKKYAPPDIEIVSDKSEADLVVLHINGRRDHRTIEAQEIKKQGKQYAIIQYVLGSSRNPDPRDWLELWNGAKAVWSYYDLREFVPDLYLAPLAADPEVFHPEPTDKMWLIGTNAAEYRVECIGEVRLAAFNIGRVLHIGPAFEPSPITDVYENVTDEQLRGLYNQCNWFSSLRRKDGFELTAVEAMLCGVRPIVFDTPNYRQWYQDLAEFVPETPPGELVRNICNILNSPPRPLTSDEIEEVKRRFNWERIIKGFWERCMN